MKLSELITTYGEDKIQFQSLDDCASSLDMNTRGTKITFFTSERLNLNGTEKLGLVVWLDREKVADILATLSAGAAALQALGGSHE